MAADDLHPINIRFTEAQLGTLRAMSKQDLVPMQRHVRRAIDLYLVLLRQPAGEDLIKRLLGQVSAADLPPAQAAAEHEQSNAKRVEFT